MNTPLKKALRRGFTLIELMIVIVIVGILALALLPNLGGSRDRAEDAGIVKSLQEIASVADLYILENGTAWDPDGALGTADIACLDDTSIFAREFNDGIMPTPAGTIRINNNGTEILCTNQYIYGLLNANDGTADGAFFVAGPVNSASNVTHVFSGFEPDEAGNQYNPLYVENSTATEADITAEAPADWLHVIAK